MNWRRGKCATTLLGINVIACLFRTPAVSAQPVPAHQHPAAHAPGPGGPALCLTCPTTRESSGTSWQPDASAEHTHDVSLGSWSLRTHLQAALMWTDEQGPRGDSGLYAPNHAMVSVRRPAMGGVFGVQTMWSLEPWMGPRGYPLLTQTGETSDETTPLIDRQHPHDLPMEVAATYARALEGGRGVFVYLAAAGAPALGPPPFMHRASASRLPIAPIGHHWFDSTHISYGVITGGFIASPAFKLEASAFNGREPDYERWGFEAPRLDSFSFRASVNPSPSVALQISAGFLDDPEQLHPGADVARFTASAMYSRPGERVGIDATVAWGQNRRTTSQVPAPGGFFVYPGSTTQAALGEATLRVAQRHAFVGRVEWAKKDELFPIDDPKHGIVYPVARATAGYVIDVIGIRWFGLSLGVAGSWVDVDDEIDAPYGGPPASLLTFLEIRTR